VLMRQQAVLLAVTRSVTAEDGGHFMGGAAHLGLRLLCFSGASALAFDERHFKRRLHVS
jgi:hypothetical protein